MKVLVTGCVSRQANPRKNHRDVMVSWLIAEALRDLGHEVVHRDPSVADSCVDYDHVFLGLSAFHSLGANRTYGVLANFLRTYQDGRVTFFVDDPEMNKIMTGIRSFKRDPDKLFKDFYSKRLDYGIASLPEMRKWLLYAIDLLHDYAWPTTVLPVFPWSNIDAYRTKLPNAVDLVGLDLSAYVPQYTTADGSNERVRAWVTEATPDNRWLKKQRPVYKVKHFGRGFEKRPVDSGLAELYTMAWGVLDPGLSNGFFNSRMIYAARSGALYITDWQELEVLGDPYRLLADTAAGFDDKTRDNWAFVQKQSLDVSTWTKEEARDAMSSLVKAKVAT